jgi:cytochrome c biogenesis protein CcmG/thiol:disulfide interchange protein DsbE
VKVNWRILGPGLTVVLLLLGLFAWSFGRQVKEVSDSHEGEPAPPFVLVDLDGKQWRLDELEGTPVVLNFWSTWCGPCKYEHPLLQQAQTAHPDIRFLGVIYSDEPIKVERYLERVGTTYPHLVDTGNRVAIDYAVQGVPETFFIDRQGIIRHKKSGPLGATELREKLLEIQGS